MDKTAIENFYASFNPSKSDDSRNFLLESVLNQSNSSIYSKWNELFTTQRLPENGWTDGSIEAFLLELSAMDGNNFEGVLGMGEREGRIFSSLIKRRHFGLAHGMGRSGNLKDSQPKAIGSTILSQLTSKLAHSALRVWGFNKKILAGGLNIMPVCTGMSIMLTLLAVRSEHKKVIWLRIDQKSCLKAILGANLEVVVVEGKLYGDEIVTDLLEIERIIEEADGRIHSIVSCVSCFAPRAPDSIVQIGRLARKYSIAHVVNAAYGGTSARACNLLNATVEEGGRIDGVVMSLDKNFMVPVGGALIFGPDKEIIARISGRYAGRASISHVIDLFVTLVGMGRSGVLGLKIDRLECFNKFKNKLKTTENDHNFDLLHTPHNDISLALKLPGHLDSSLGSQLFYRNISGARVIQIRKNDSKRIENLEFINFGSHYSKWINEFSYLNIAAGVGSKVNDIDELLKKLSKLTLINKNN